MSEDLGLFPLGDVPREAAHRPTCLVDPTLPIDETVTEKFWSRVVKSSTCWWWTGAISTPDGYGRITWRRSHRQRSLSAHRFALMLTEPSLLSDEAIAEHWCNFPLCVRVAPGHVQLGSQASNVAYAVATGRHRGSRPVTSDAERLAMARAIRAWLRSGGDPDDVPGRSQGSRDDPTLF